MAIYRVTAPGCDKSIYVGSKTDSAAARKELVENHAAKFMSVTVTPLEYEGGKTGLLKLLNSL